MNWTVTWFRPDGAATAAAVAGEIARFLVRGIASRTPAAVRRALSVVREDDLATVSKRS
jgi:Tetracyclin repressor-like, C-terminal domain